MLRYRRTRDEMPAVPEEVYESEEEGVRVIYLVASPEVLKERNRVAWIKMLTHALGQAFGGDYEGVDVYGGLLAARAAG